MEFKIENVAFALEVFLESVALQIVFFFVLDLRDAKRDLYNWELHAPHPFVALSTGQMIYICTYNFSC